MGQHFLTDQGVIDRILDYANLSPDDTVLEIGPGTGNLTSALSKRAKFVYAIELDFDLAQDLIGRFSNVKVIQGDAQKVEFPDFNKIVSNLPYQISSAITLRFLPLKFDLAVLMYQREFVKRMIARQGDEGYGRLSLNVSHYVDVEIMETVPTTAFRPSPHVSSSIVRIIPKTDIEAVDPLIFSELTRVLFSMRRKKVKKAIRAILSKESVLKLDPQLMEKRPEDLSTKDAVLLAKAIKELRRES